jgi:hypothetical protein
MTNEEKAARLEEIAEHFIPIGDKDAALLREAAQLMRERERTAMRNPMKNPQPGDRFLLPHRLGWEEVEITRIFWDLHNTWQFVEYGSSLDEPDITRLVRLKTLKRRIAKGRVMLEDKND